MTRRGHLPVKEATLYFAELVHAVAVLHDVSACKCCGILCFFCHCQSTRETHMVFNSALTLFRELMARDRCPKEVGGRG